MNWSLLTIWCMACLSIFSHESHAHMVPGSGCGVSTPIAKPKSLKSGSHFRCVYAETKEEFRKFLQKCQDLWTEGCKESLGPQRLVDKSKWTAFANQVFGNDPSTRGPQFAIDNYIKPGVSFHLFLQQKQPGDGWLQVSLEKAHDVSGVLIEQRRDCCWRHNARLEIRVGMTDTSPLPKGRLTANEFCALGDDTIAVTLEYDCGRPIRGKHVTVQKVELGISDTWAFNVNELEVFVVQL